MKKKSSLLFVVSLVCLATVYTASPARAWETAVVDNGPVLGPTSLAVDGGGSLHLVYRDSLSHRLKYATNTSGEWVLSWIETNPVVTADEFSLALDTADRLHIVLCSPGPRLWYLSNAEGLWTLTELEPGLRPSIAVDAAGYAHICSVRIPEVWYTTNKTGAWVNEKVDPATVMWPSATSISVDLSGHVHLVYGSYMDSYYLDGQEAYVTNASGSWVETPLPVDLLSGGKAWKPSLAVDASNRVHLSYLGMGLLGNGFTLVHAAKQGQTFASEIASWERSGSSPPFPLSTDMTTDIGNRVHIGYTYKGTSGSFRLKYATNVNGSWEVSGPLSEGIDSTGSSIGVDSSGKVHLGYVDGTGRLLVTSGRAEGLTPMWPGTLAEASVYGEESRQRSGLFNLAAPVLVAAGAILCMRMYRRSKRSPRAGRLIL